WAIGFEDSAVQTHGPIAQCSDFKLMGTGLGLDHLPSVFERLTIGIYYGGGLVIKGCFEPTSLGLLCVPQLDTGNTAAMAFAGRPPARNRAAARIGSYSAVSVSVILSTTRDDE